MHYRRDSKSEMETDRQTRNRDEEKWSENDGMERNGATVQRIR